MAGILSGDRTSANEVSTGELVNRAAEQISRLVREELALARVEMVRKGKRAGIGGGLLGGAGVLAIYSVGLLLALIAVLLDLVWPAWLAVLVVLAVVLAAAAAAALLGRAQLKRAVPPMPKEAVEGFSEDVDVVKAAIQNGRRA